MLERFAALVVAEAEALTATNVRAVGRNVSVKLSMRRGDGAVQALDSVLTNDQGGFLIGLPSGTSEDTCRFILSVGSGQSLTRAFVYSTTEPIIVDYASETAVALILGRVQQGADLCEFSTGDIRSLVNSIRALPGDVTGVDIFETNRNALQIAANDPGIQADLPQLGGATPVATVTPSCTPQPTPTPAALSCVGDCDANGGVTVDEIVRLVNIALNGETRPSTCPGVAQWCTGPAGIEITCLVAAVDNALSGCPLLPTLSLSVHVARNADTKALRAVADLKNSGSVPVSYLSGCSALCRPKIYQAISLELVGPNATDVFVEYPCGSVLLCPEFPQVFSPGESVEQALDVTGTEWKQDTTAADECGSCVQENLEPGWYKVIAEFRYSTDLNNPWPFAQHIEASAEFEWP